MPDRNSFEEQYASGNVAKLETSHGAGESSANYEIAELKPRFSVLAAIGIQFSISATPLAIGGYLTFILGVGGSPFFFYGFIVASIGQIFLCASLAEIAAVHPHASGKDPYCESM